jgi:hypothetical protein
MAMLHVEKLGGLAGFGGPGARVRSRGKLDTTTLSVADQKSVEALFQKPANERSSPARDRFRYKITRTTSAGTETIEVPEESVPHMIAQCVVDELI